MSTLYNVEPQPTAKVLLHTTAGDVLVEIFAQQTPVTSRNFLQHCLDSYYDNTIFHRLVPGFIIQGGDPTGTGHGGESSYDGAPFADEFHSRLKFNRRGLLGMANTGERDDNSSQFFFTLGKTEELTGRNTMFGRVAGDTIFNLVKMGEAELTEDEGSERPMYPTKITGTEVLVNPFDGLVRRAKEVQPKIEDKQPKKKSAKKNAGKALLSFGTDEGHDQDIAPITVTKYNPKLINADKAIPPSAVSNGKRRSEADALATERPAKRIAPSAPIHELDPDEQSKPNIAGSASITPARSASKQTSKTITLHSESESGSESDSEIESRPRNTELLTATNAQIEVLKSSLKREAPVAALESARPKSALEAMIPQGAIRGRKRPKQSSNNTSISKDEQRTLDSFNAFKKRLEDASSASASRKVEKQTQSNGSNGAGPDDHKSDRQNTAKGLSTSTNKAADDDGGGEGEEVEEANLCDLHFIANCQSCSNWEFAEAADGGEGNAGDSDTDDVGWMGRQLTFAKDRLGKDLEWKRQNEQDLVVIDPKEKAREIKEKKRERRERDSGKGKR